MDYRAFIRDELPVIFPPPPRPVSEELFGFGRRLAAGKVLSGEEARRAMEIMIGVGGAPYETALFLSALRPDACAPESLAAMAAVMRANALRVIPSTPSARLGDNCGTGGDDLHLLNISTTAMFILAAAGLLIAKHGNRASTSRSGSADVLAALGARVELPPEGVARCIARAGIGFMFAPLYHPAMRKVAAVRRALPFRTIFNLLGPLCNPAPIAWQLLGVHHPAVMEPAARALALSGANRALVVCGDAGGGMWMDEVSLSGRTRALLVRDGAVSVREIDPAALGLRPAALGELRGGSPEDNARALRRVLDGSDAGPRREICILNAAAGLYAAGAAADVAEGLAMAREALAGGAALGRLEGFIEESRREANPKSQLQNPKSQIPNPNKG